MKPPFSFTFYREGYAPYVLDVGSGLSPGNGTTSAQLIYEWQALLPSGGPYTMTLTDANNAIGVVSGPILKSSPKDCICAVLTLSNPVFSAPTPRIPLSREMTSPWDRALRPLWVRRPLT